MRNGCALKYFKSRGKKRVTIGTGSVWFQLDIRKEEKMKVVIAAAGTAGHINPGLAIAKKIQEEQKDSKIIFIGTTRGLENDLVPRAGYELKTIDAYGLSKKISIENIRKMIKTLKGFGEAKKILKEIQPDIVIGTGGYICGATISSAHRLKIPTVLHESNAFPGKAVKMLAKKTDTILVSFEDAIGRIKHAKKIVYTGTPVKIKKQNYTKAQRDEIIKKSGLKSDMPIVLVFGGSQGARRINNAIMEIIKSEANQNYQMIWATGPKQYDIVKEELENNHKNINYIKNMKILPYIYNMEEIMNIADVIIARSGAMTITEIANLGKPSILVPLPNVSHNHQLYNAEVLQNVGSADIILDNELTGEKLNTNIEKIVLDKDKCKTMGEKALTVATNDVENKIYAQIVETIKTHSQI